MILYGYSRSSAAWRVRIALELKGLKVEHRAVQLRRGEQRSSAYLAVQPQGLVPALVLADGRVLTQSMAIIEYLDETVPEPALLPPDPFARAQVRAMAQVIACDTHPVQNLKILERVRAFGGDEAAAEWAKVTIVDGLSAFEALASRYPGQYAYGSSPGLADLCVIAQLGNARRFGVDIVWPRIASIEAACMELSAFQVARPERQLDFE